jgi:uncharacterized protein (DUF1330 family)
MEAFVVFTREETTDPQELATYSAGVGPSFDGHDVTFLAAYGAMDHLEGPPVEGAVICVSACKFDPMRRGIGVQL